MKIKGDLNSKSLTGSDSTTPTYIDFYEDTDNGTNKIQIIAPSSISGNQVLTLPEKTDTVATITDVYYSIQLVPAAINPADATTYYMGGSGLQPQTTATAVDFNLGYAVTIIGALVKVSGNTTAGTNENITLQLRNTTQSTSTSIGTFTSDGGSTTAMSPFTFTGLNISVASGDSICAQFDTPTWATNPISTRWYVEFLVKRTS